MTELLLAGFGDHAVDYADGWALQRRLHEGVVARTTPDTLVLLEHQPVFTAGRRTDASERPTDGTPVIDVDRGGKITWHGPGQLVGYPILRLAEPIDVVGYVRRLEGILIDVLDELGVECGRVDGRSGVWVSRGGADFKIAAIGIRIAHDVTMHGFALNCSNSLEPYSRIVACGIRDAGVTTISECIGRVVQPSDVAPLIADRFLDSSVIAGFATAAEVAA
ncbi:lipoyl(octanoyl) transferase [Agreia bicolorata]|uniref:Octanoyltransferase n=1 Tax=Agreia bicolorata TaxID=110935 RepID=A0A1T4YI44_9MICO|nr:lipoyl(octanoyl) transferase LipB [Agreia bicolorata]KJC63776.1 octanoyltransferase [Agreia bicolorata]SKB00895.1 lipoyl(octanoyl) transferase [Agreia bicolorata]